MKIFRSKKASDDEWSGMKFFALLVFIMIAGAVGSFIFSGFISQTTRDSEIPDNFEIMQIIESLISSKDCIAYQDETGRVYTHIIDINKFNNATLARCVNLEEFDINFNLKLKIIDSGKKYNASTIGWYGKNFKTSYNRLSKVRLNDNSEVLGELNIEVKET